MKKNHLSVIEKLKSKNSNVNSIDINKKICFNIIVMYSESLAWIPFDKEDNEEKEKEED